MQPSAHHCTFDTASRAHPSPPSYLVQQGQHLVGEPTLWGGASTFDKGDHLREVARGSCGLGHMCGLQHTLTLPYLCTGAHAMPGPSPLSHHTPPTL